MFEFWKDGVDPFLKFLNMPLICNFQLLLARLMAHYCSARWRLLSSSVGARLSASSVVVCNAAGGGRAGREGGRVADTARRASTVTSDDTLLYQLLHFGYYVPIYPRLLLLVLGHGIDWEHSVDRHASR